MSAYGINDSGEIVGYGEYKGQDVAFLLTPTPEPSTFALLAASAFGLFVFRLAKARTNRSPIRPSIESGCYEANNKLNTVSNSSALLNDHFGN